MHSWSFPTVCTAQVWKLRVTAQRTLAWSSSKTAFKGTFTSPYYRWTLPHWYNSSLLLYSCGGINPGINPETITLSNKACSVCNALYTLLQKREPTLKCYHYNLTVSLLKGKIIIIMFKIHYERLATGVTYFMTTVVQQMVQCCVLKFGWAYDLWLLI